MKNQDLMIPDVVEYAKLLSDITGQDISIANGRDNNVIGALASKGDDFKEFKSNFVARLKRLNAIPNEHDAFVTKAKCIANNNWDGAYAELAVYDWLVSASNFSGENIKFDTHLDPSETYAAEFGKPDVDLDGYIDEFNVYYDVKSLHDNTNDFIRLAIRGALHEVYPNVQNQPLVIPSFNTNDSSRLIDETANGNGSLFVDLKNELVAALKEDKRSYGSEICKGVTFNIEKRIGIGTKISDPYHRASVDYKKVLSYSYKFTKNKPFILFLVVFPWYNSEVTDFADFNRLYYRSLARRVFCQFKDRPTLASSEIPGFCGNDTMYDVTRKLSAIVFLEDMSIGQRLDDNGQLPVSNVKSYIYINPNSDNPLYNSAVRYLDPHNASIIDFDDFKYDNY